MLAPGEAPTPCSAVVADARYESGRGRRSQGRASGATNTTREQGCRKGGVLPARSPWMRYGDETVVLSPLALTVKMPHGFDV